MAKRKFQITFEVERDAEGEPGEQLAELKEWAKEQATPYAGYGSSDIAAWLEDSSCKASAKVEQVS